ncbi:hypothetical protein BJV82DRAFT_619779 [Fennellomyces sp. T-0311]|nr:hypothetical protein BJV82DRAFT_619779 [Fennellomyces sp. T-0311]
MQHYARPNRPDTPEPYSQLPRSDVDIPVVPLYRDDRRYERPPEPLLPPPPLPPEPYHRRSADRNSIQIVDLRSMQWESSNRSRPLNNGNHSFWRSGDQWHDGAGPSNGSNSTWRRSTYEPTRGWDGSRERNGRPPSHEDAIPVHTLRPVGPFEPSDTEPVDNELAPMQSGYYTDPATRSPWVRSSLSPPSPPPPPFYPQGRQQPRLRLRQQQQQQQQPRQQQQQQRQTDAQSQDASSLDEIIKKGIDPNTLPRGTLESILLVDYANSLNELEFSELAPQVARLANRRRTELAASNAQSSSDALLCPLCCDLQMDCVFLDCGHLASCMQCAQKISNNKNECPICRRRVIKLLHVYTS